MEELTAEETEALRRVDEPHDCSKPVEVPPSLVGRGLVVSHRPDEPCEHPVWYALTPAGREALSR
jgi:hypothetical protein